VEKKLICVLPPINPVEQDWETVLGEMG
jgi:hypothetical protein